MNSIIVSLVGLTLPVLHSVGVLDLISLIYLSALVVVFEVIYNWKKVFAFLLPGKPINEIYGLTQSEYDAMATHDPDTVYLITAGEPNEKT